MDRYAAQHSAKTSGESGESGQRWRCGRASGWGRRSSPHADFHPGPLSVQCRRRLDLAWSTSVPSQPSQLDMLRATKRGCHATRPSCSTISIPPCPSPQWCWALVKMLARWLPSPRSRRLGADEPGTTLTSSHYIKELDARSLDW